MNTSAKAVSRGESSLDPLHIYSKDDRYQCSRSHSRTLCCRFWRGAAIDRALDHTSDGWADPVNKADMLKDHTSMPDIYDQMRSTERGIDLIALFNP